MRRKTYVVFTRYEAVKTYEILAFDAIEAKKLIKDGYRAGLTNIEETFKVEGAYRKEKVK